MAVGASWCPALAVGPRRSGGGVGMRAVRVGVSCRGGRWSWRWRWVGGVGGGWLVLGSGEDPRRVWVGSGRWASGWAPIGGGASAGFLAAVAFGLGVL